MVSWPAGELESEPEYNVHFSSEEGLTVGVRHPGFGGCWAAGWGGGGAGWAFTGADGKEHWDSEILGFKLFRLCLFISLSEGK